MDERERTRGKEKEKAWLLSFSAPICSECRWSSIHSALHVCWGGGWGGQEEREGKWKSGEMVGGVEGRGALGDLS